MLRVNLRIKYLRERHNLAVAPAILQVYFIDSSSSVMRLAILSPSLQLKDLQGIIHARTLNPSGHKFAACIIQILPDLADCAKSGAYHEVRSLPGLKWRTRRSLPIATLISSISPPLPWHKDALCGGGYLTQCLRATVVPIMAWGPGWTHAQTNGKL
ncbi:hypothetical protein BDP27DRAFT_1357316 [Rhodocollybia butyracea]|uniref:Uncharacterized protein n=1 Tax=Rhodocollybia butyracea TaxID=206335 RepID=A0A9P5UG82_9AGAR|nr:hypothetical protein BDP27DRAFT_1357316 [Rhodocollybia butyracea]